MTTHVQPLIHDSLVLLKAPTQAWSRHDGSIGRGAIDGLYFSDVRIVSRCAILIGGAEPEHIATALDGADRATFVSLLRGLDDAEPDPGVRLEHSRVTSISGVSDSLVLRSRLDRAIETTIAIELDVDASPMELIKGGIGERAEVELEAVRGGARWTGDDLVVTVSPNAATPGRTEIVDGTVRLTAEITIPARGEVEFSWSVLARDEAAPVVGARGPVPWRVPTVQTGDERLARWVRRGLEDLDALRMSPAAHPDRTFIAAGAPWFLTLFGRDSLWTARFMLPTGTELAHDTLRVLADLQGTKDVPDTAEEPGKILHEVRREPLAIPGTDVVLPPVYFGTVDATALWVCLLHDAWRWGLADDDARALLPNLVAALEWMRDFGDADGDGLLEYVDRSGHGLANQGWKDSGDSVQWRDGRLADGPIALCEVQAYAFEAAMHGADLLDHFGVDGGDFWRRWAGDLRSRFNESFWIDDPDGAYPAIALDAAKRPVDTVTSNLGHLLGTGLLTPAQSALVARRLVSPQLDSGFGLRTMSSDSDGYWPLSYHGGSVWTHDTAIAIAGLTRDGFADEAATLTAGLLAAASAFEYRMPELHSGDAAASISRPVPYPAACRPQAWSAAASVSVLASVLGLDAAAHPGELAVAPSSAFGAVRVEGLTFGGEPLDLTVDASGELTAAAGAPVVVG